MNHYVQSIKVNSLFHLHDIEINIPEESPHLLITGKNGSGKTIILKALADFLELVRNDRSFSHLKVKELLDYWNNKLEALESSNPQDRLRIQSTAKIYQNQFNLFFGKVSADFSDVYQIAQKIQNKDFILAYYPAERKPHMLEPKNPTKPQLPEDNAVAQNVSDQFLAFLSDLKIQEALARNDSHIDEANHIKAWFDDFERLMMDIYQDEDLKLEFNYKDYSFTINTLGKSFKFTQMSDGFIAAIDIIADLVLKMQNDDSPVRSYQKEGIVLIDEIETHLHLELQRMVMPLLTRVFPNIQFIVTTHSPFVLSSLNNAVAYDLEHRTPIDELAEYSYEALAEGYFGVKTSSSYMRMRLDSLHNLLKNGNLTNGEMNELKSLIQTFEAIPEAVSPLIVGEYRQLKMNFSEIFKSLE